MLSASVLAVTPDCARCKGIIRVAPTWRLHINPHGGFGADYDGQIVLDLIAAAGALKRGPLPALRERTSCVCGLEATCDIVHLWDFGLLVIVFGVHDYVEIRAADLAARLDKWTPLWRMSRMSAIEAAPDVPVNEEV